MFYILIFLIPLQTRKLLYSWNPEGFNEYLNAYLYITDLVIAGLFFCWFLRFIKNGKNKQECFGSLGQSCLFFVVGLFFLVTVLSLIKAQNIGLGLYQLIKLGEFLLLFLYIQVNLKLFDISKIAIVFVASAIFQSLMAIMQFLKQSDFGMNFLHTILQYSPLSSDLPYVANFFVGSDKIIRAYGGFPHPNVLAAFLVAALFFLYFLFLKRKRNFKIWSGPPTSWANLVHKMSGWGRLASDIVLGASLFILLLGLVLTFSRAALGIYLLATFILFIFLFFVKNLRKIYFHESLNLFVLLLTSYFLLLLIFYPYLISRFQLNPQEEAVVHRAQYSEEAQSQIKGNLLFGVGIGNFIPTFKSSLVGAYEEFYQPVHNIFLLIASEIGIIGFILFIMFLVLIFFRSFKTFISVEYPEKQLLIISFLLLAICFIFIGFFDHFFWTLQQGRLMFWIILGLFSATTMNYGKEND